MEIKNYFCEFSVNFNKIESMTELLYVYIIFRLFYVTTFAHTNMRYLIKFT